MPFVDSEDELVEPTEEAVEPQEQRQIEPPGDSYADTFRYVRQKRQQIMDGWQRRQAAKQAEKQGAQELGEEATESLSKQALVKGEGQLLERGASQAGRQVASQAGRQVAKQAGRQVASQAGRQVAKQAGKAVAETAARKAAGMGARWAAEAVTGTADAGLSWLLLAADVLISAGLYFGKKYGGYILLAIALILVLPAIVFSLLWGKTGPSITPSTEAERNEATTLAAVGGSASASRETIVRWAQSSKTKFSSLKSIAPQKLSGGRLASFQSQASEMLALLDNLISASGNSAERDKTMEQITTLMGQMTKDYPELLNTRDSCAKLAPYIASNMFEIGPLGKENARLVVRGLLKNKAGEIYPASPDLCATILSVVSSGIRIKSDTFSLGHEKYSGNKTSGTRISQHWCGEAIDIQYVNGVHVGHNEETKKAMEAIRLAASNGIGVWDSFGPFYDLQLNDGRPYSKNIGGHDNHIHLSGKPINIACHRGK